MIKVVSCIYQCLIRTTSAAITAICLNLHYCYSADAMGLLHDELQHVVLHAILQGRVL
jgi:hypothetical protein